MGTQLFESRLSHLLLLLLLLLDLLLLLELSHLGPDVHGRALHVTGTKLRPLLLARGRRRDRVRRRLRRLQELLLLLVSSWR